MSAVIQPNRYLHKALIVAQGFASMTRRKKVLHAAACRMGSTGQQLTCSEVLLHDEDRTSSCKLTGSDMTSYSVTQPNCMRLAAEVAIRSHGHSHDNVNSLMLL